MAYRRRTDPPSDVGGLSRYVREELDNVTQAENDAREQQQLVARTSEPARPRVGMLAFADGYNWNPGAGEGLYEYRSSGWKKAGGSIQALIFPIGDETTAITTGTAKVTYRAPYSFVLSGVKASLTTEQTSGSVLTVDVKRGGTSIFSTLLTFDNGEKTTATAATAAVVADYGLVDDDEITVDVTQVGDGTATGLKVYLIGYPAYVGTPHTATGALIGQIGGISGSATNLVVNQSSGALVGQIGSVSGTAERYALHTASGALVGQIGAVSGSSTHTAPNTGTGALVGQIGAISGSATRGDPDSTAWAAAVTAAGGTYTQAQRDALDALILGLKNDGIWSLLKVVVPICGNDLTASLVAYVAGSWVSLTNGGLVSGDFSSSTGWTGNGSSKHVKTSWLVNSLTANDTHLSSYQRSSAATIKSHLGADNLGSTARILMAGPYADSKIYSDQYNTSTSGGRLSPTTASSQGFFIGNRSASNVHKVYRNGSSIGSNTTTGGSLPSLALWLMCNNANGGVADHSAGVFAWFSAGQAFNDTQAANYYTRIQTYQTALGRNV